MSDALTPLRQVYGLEPASGPETPEHGVLRALRDALDARPPLAPPADVLDAVLARAAEPRGALAFESDAQAAALAPILDALDRVPRPSPPDSVVAAVEARAAEAAGSLAAVRHIYQDAPAPEAGTLAAVESDVLRSTREAVERSLRSQPQARPSQAAVDAILARAAEPQAQEEPVPAESPVEEAVLTQSFQALDRLPRYAPSAAALDAVIAAAAVPPVPKARPARPAAAPRDRAAAPVRRRPVGVWASAGALALAAVFALTLLPREAAAPEAPAALAVAEQAEPAPQPPAETDAEAVTPPPAAPAPTPFSSALAANQAAAAFAPAVERPSSGPSAPAPPPSRAAPRVAPPTPAVASAEAPAAAPLPAWEASDDVRALSLRLQELDTDDLAWDEPTEAFGARPAAASGTPGVQAVGATRARARMIDTNDQR